MFSSFNTSIHGDSLHFAVYGFQVWCAYIFCPDSVINLFLCFTLSIHTIYVKQCMYTTLSDVINSATRPAPLKL